MKFKAVNVVKNKGDLVELDPVEKTRLAVTEGASPLFEGCHVFAKNVVVSEVAESPNGDKLKKLWANNIYTAGGEATFHRRKLETDTVLEPVVKKFAIEFKDTLDSNGLPEIEIMSYSIT